MQAIYAINVPRNDGDVVVEVYGERAYDFRLVRDGKAVFDTGSEYDGRGRMYSSAVIALREALIFATNEDLR